MDWHKPRAAGDAAEQLMGDVTECVKGAWQSYVEAEEATEGTEQSPAEEMLRTGNFYLTAGKSAVTLGAHAIRTANKFSEAAKLEKAGKDVAAEFAKREAARSFKIGGVETRAVDTALDALTFVKAIGDDAKNGSCWEKLKAGGTLIANVASQNMKEPCSLLSGKNLSVVGKWNELTLNTSKEFNITKNFKLAKNSKLAKLDPVTTTVEFVHAGWKCYKERSGKPLVEFAGRTIGNVGGQMAGRVVGGLIGSCFGPVGTAIGAGIGGVIGGAVGGYVGEKIGGCVADGAKKAWGWIKSWF